MYIQECLDIHGVPLNMCLRCLLDILLIVSCESTSFNKSSMTVCHHVPSQISQNAKGLIDCLQEEEPALPGGVGGGDTWSVEGWGFFLGGVCVRGP